MQGYGASSLWKQRAHRWTVSALRITGIYLYGTGVSSGIYSCMSTILVNEEHLYVIYYNRSTNLISFMILLCRKKFILLFYI